MGNPQVVDARILGFICLNAHPAGCAANVDRQIEIARAGARAGAGGRGIGHALVIGSSTGYGLSSLITTTFGYGARALGVCLERAPHADKTGSAGWYNVAAVHARARAAGLSIETVNGDAYATETKSEVLARLEAWSAPLDAVVYSLASPRRVDPATGRAYVSVLKPVGRSYASKSINLGNDQVVTSESPPATDADIEATTKVMGGEDWALWMRALLDRGLLADGCRAVAFSYIGPELTYPIYRSGTIGKAKEHVELTSRALDAELGARVGGRAVVAVAKALVTQASAAIPVVPLYISILYKLMKAKGTHEGTIEQIVRLYRDHLAPGVTPVVDDAGRVRIDDRELDPDVQAAVSRVWDAVNTENLFALSDYAGFKREFRSLFGFEVPGIDYSLPVDIDVPLD